MRFLKETAESPDFLHVAIHELFHIASGDRGAPLVETVDGSYLKIKSGMSSYPVGRPVSLHEGNRKSYLGSVREGMTDILTRMNLPPGATPADPNFRIADMFIVHALVRKLREVRAQKNLDYNLRDAWEDLQNDYIHNTHTTLKDVEVGFGRGGVRAISKFENVRDGDYEVFEMLYPQFNGSFGKGMVSMMFGRENEVSNEFKTLEAELFAAVKG